tara:strand:+ start:11119 stop:12585 length:1467 start_codon:yes stop_codon:yes gene_type:complete
MDNLDNLEKLIWFDPQKCFIDGVWQDPNSNNYLPLLNPSSGKEICRIARCSDQDVNLAVSAARHSLDGEWGQFTALERGRILQKIGSLVKDKIDLLSKIESIDVGKPLSQSKADAIALARYLEFYSGAADKIHGETIPYQNGYTVYTLKEPHGVTAHIIPWNYPMQIIGRSVVGALTMGNAVVLKPSEDACLTALAFADICREANLPKGALNVITGYGSETGEILSKHSGINHISFTGSVQVGTKIQKNAAENIVPVTLELGGKSPQIVFSDANISQAIPFLMKAGLQNAGQTCSASSRILIQKSIYTKVEKALAAQYKNLTIGPAIQDFDLGPLISKKQVSMVQKYLNLGLDLKKIAELKLNDKHENGSFISPTLFGMVDPSHALAQEEIFGPIQVLIPFDDEEEAIKIANGTKFGLVAGIWTNDGSRQLRMAKKIKAGQVFINNYGAGGGVELPFGGTGHSGYGREKGFEALNSFSTIKTIAINHG